MVNIGMEIKNSSDIYIINNHNEMKDRAVSIEGFARVRQFHLDISRSILCTCVCVRHLFHISYVLKFTRNTLKMC